MTTSDTLPPIGAEERYAAVVETLLRRPGVTPPPEEARPTKRFGSTSLKVNGRIFAMFVRGTLVLKLPAHRVDALIASGEGRRFEAGRGRLMKEWVAVEAAYEQRWLSRAKEALKFVSSLR